MMTIEAVRSGLFESSGAPTRDQKILVVSFDGHVDPLVKRQLRLCEAKSLAEFDEFGDQLEQSQSSAIGTDTEISQKLSDSLTERAHFGGLQNSPSSGHGCRRQVRGQHDDGCRPPPRPEFHSLLGFLHTTMADHRPTS
jgi:hypothetical protein